MLYGHRKVTKEMKFVLIYFGVALISCNAQQRNVQVVGFESPKPFINLNPKPRVLHYHQQALRSANANALDSSGRYIHDNSGQYVHNENDGRYIHDNSGRYNHDDSGKYSGKNIPYKHIDNPGGQYRGGQNPNQKNSNNIFGATNPPFVNSKQNQIRKKIQSLGVLPISPRPFQEKEETTTQFGNKGLELNGKPDFLTGNEIPAASNTNERNSARVNPNFGSFASATENFGKFTPTGFRILNQHTKLLDDGYNYSYETENKINMEEEGKFENRGTDKELMKVKGSYSYTGPDNVVYTVYYTADENGFVPFGAHLPTPPPIPAEIQKALALIKQNRV